MKRRFLSTLMALVLALSLIPTAAFAADEDGGTDVTPTVADVTTTETDLETTGEETLAKETTGEIMDASALMQAVGSATDRTELTLGADITLKSNLTIADNKVITLDLNGKTLDAGANVISVTSGSELTIEDRSNGAAGKISAQNQIEVESASLVLNSGMIEITGTSDHSYGVYVSEDGSAIVNGGTITSNYAPLGGNNTTGDMNFEVHGGTLTAKNGPAIYMPGQVMLDITDGTLNGGISLRMGQVTISGGTINAATGKPDSPSDYYNFSGNAWLPDALYVFNGTYTSDNATYRNSLKLDITGGIFNCANGQGSAVAIYDLGKVEQNSEISISGSAELTTNTNGRSAYAVLSLEDIGVTQPETGYGVHSGKVSSAITGGRFSTNVGAYVAPNYECVGDESSGYTVQKMEDKLVVSGEVTGSSDSASVSGTLHGSFATNGTIEGQVGEGESQPTPVTSNVTVDLTTGDGTDAKTTQLTVTANAAQSLARADSLTVQTDAGDVAFDDDALNKMSMCGTEGVVITVTDRSADYESEDAVEAAYTVTATSGGDNLLPYGGSDNGTVTITVDKPANEEITDLQTWYVTNDDSLTYVERLDMKEVDGDKVEITISHLSTIVLVDADRANLPKTVAQIVGGNTFTTLADAIGAAQNGQTVQLLDNVQLSSPVTVENKKVTLDLKGYTITPAEVFSGNRLITVGSAGALTVQDSGTNGSIGTETSYTERGISTSGTVRIEGGTVYGSKIAILVSPNAELEVTGGTVTVPGVENSLGQAIKAQFESTVRISGGTSQGGMGYDKDTNTMGSAVDALSSKIEISGDAKLSGYGGIGLFNLTSDGQVDNVEGAIPSSLEMTGGSITTQVYAVSGNNLQSAGTTVTISGGQISSKVGGAIYWPMEGVLTINGTAEVTGPTAIEIKMGTLEIGGNAVITGTADPANQTDTTGDGVAIPDGSALRVSAEKYGDVEGQYLKNNNLKVTITGGTLKSSQGDAITVYNTGEKANTSSLAVSGGSLQPGSGRAAVTYLSESEGDTTQNTTQLENGTLETEKSQTTVTVSQNVAKAAVNAEGTTSYYNTVDEAITAASDETAEAEITVFGNGTVSAENLSLKDNIKLTVAANVELSIPVTSGESNKVVTASTDEDGNTTYQLVEAGAADDYVATITVGENTAYYEDLAAAVKSVQNGQTITLTQKVTDEEITVSRPVTFTINPGNTESTYTIEAGSGYVLSRSGNTYTISVYTPPVPDDDDRPGTSSGGSSDPSYSPIMDVTGNGDVSVSPRTPSEGDEVTITVEPDRGYEVGDVTVTDRDGDTVRVTANRDGTYTFEQPRGRVTIEVTFVPTGTATFFTDVPASFWAYDEIKWAYDNGYVNGTSATTFSPNASISRQQVWMILARLSGQSPANMAEARQWAIDNGISDGTTPGNAVTRQQLVALLYRYATMMGYANDARADLSIYPDVDTVASYAVEPMQWSVANNIVAGTSDGTLNPTGTATRAQFAVILYRFWEQIG